MIGGANWDTSIQTTTTQKPTTTQKTTAKPPTTTTKPTTKPDPWPTAIAGSNTHPYCFRDEINSGKYKSWKPSEGQKLIASVCSASDRLNPATYGHTSAGANGLIASIQWSKSQSGCPTKDFLPLGDQCILNMQDIYLWCDDGALRDEYMGGAITLSTDYGCVTLYLGTSESSSMQLNSFMDVEESDEPRTLEGDELRAFLQEMEELEPLLPVRRKSQISSSVAPKTSVSAS
jgi:hypothetical protein